MANYPKYDLNGKTPAATYRNIVQYNFESSSLVDSYGDDLPQLAITASWAITASVSILSFVTQSVTQSITSSIISSSLADYAHGATTATSSFDSLWATQSLLSNNSVSASWASQSLSASWAPFTDTGTTLYTGSTYEITSSNSLTSSHVAGNHVFGPVTDSVNSTSASYADQSLSASWAPFTQVEQVSASWASQSLSASWAPFTDTGTTLVTASTYQITSSNAVSASWIDAGNVHGTVTSSSYALSASWAPDQTVTVNSASWASSSLSASAVYTLTQEVNIDGPTNVGDTTPYTSLKVIGREGWPARIIQGGSFVTQSARPVLYVYRDLDQSQAQVTPLLQLRTLETGSLAPLMVASNDVSDVFTIDYSGSITASGLFGTASYATNAVSASYSMTASALTPSSGLTTNVYISASNGDITMSFVNGLLISVT